MKINMRTKIFFLSIILILPLANVFAQERSEVAFVESFYKFHRARMRVFNAREVELHKKWFSPELNKLFQNELKREKEFLQKNPTDKPHFGDGFPFAPYEACSSNGKNVKNVTKIAPQKNYKGTATVEVKFYQPKVCGGELIETYIVELMWNANGWLIYDWIYADGERLTDDLKRTEY